MDRALEAVLNKSELSLLLSLSDCDLESWLRLLAQKKQKRVLEQLDEFLEAKRPPASPAALGARVWGPTWQMARHLRLLDESLVDLANRKVKRLLVMMPPRHGKSVLISQFFPAWYLGMNPDHRVILASYEANFAAGWGRKSRDILEEHGSECFQVNVRTDSAAANQWDLKGRFGGMTTSGIGGPITGRGADLLIVDDPVKNAEQALSETYREKTWQWWTSTAFTRLEPDAVAVIVQTRWHDDDLVGRVEKYQVDDSWRVLKFPAIAEADDELDRSSGEPLWPERFSNEKLEEIKRSLPLHWWDSLYQQRPGHHTNVLWPPEYFQGEELWFDQWPDGLKLRVMTLDPSKGKGTAHSDFSAYVLLGIAPGGTIYVEADMSNSRPPSQLVDDGAQLHVRFSPDAFRIEGNAWQDLLAPMFVEEFRRRGIFTGNIGQIENRINKQLRIETLDPLLRARQFRFRRTCGTELLVDQLKNFPVARHDDGPDALEMAVRTAREFWNEEPIESITPWNLRGGLF